MTETAASLDERRQRKTPAWNPETQRHAWEDIDEDGHHHKCFHCWVRYHSEPSGAGYVKAWSHGSRSGRSKSLGPCPGPDGRPTLTVVPEPPVLEVVAGDGGAVPPKPAAGAVCCRCVPPLTPCGRRTHPTVHGPLCEPQRDAAARARAAHLAELRTATSGMGVPTWGGAA